MDSSALLLEQAGKTKAINPAAHVWVYRNLVKALSWYAILTPAVCKALSWHAIARCSRQHHASCALLFALR
jgi:hypothetical protein